MRSIFLLIILSLISNLLIAQSEKSENQLDQTFNNRVSFLNYPQKLSRTLTEQQNKLSRQIQKKTEKYLIKLQREEVRIRRKLPSQDSALMNELQLGEGNALQKFNTILINDSILINSFPNGYSGRLDSMITILNFMEAQPNLMLSQATALDNLKKQYSELEKTFKHAERLKSLVTQRKLLLQEKLGHLPIGKTWTKYQKQVIYYQQQIEEYKQLINHPDLIEQKALALIRELPAFRSYFDKYSFLSSIFRLPGETEDLGQTQLQGLQTRSMVIHELVGRMGNAATAQQTITSGIQQGQAELASLKNRLMNLIEQGESPEMPGFKPNNQKSKSFLKRLEIGTNMQTVRSNQFFPITSDLGFSAGYKLNQKSVIGVGVSYKVGWGRGIRYIKISNEGFGMRTFIDVRIQKSWWITGGGEWNYRERFNNFLILKTFAQWQQSILFGVQKKQKLGKHTSTASLLYDALWNKQVPITQPIMFRVGYSLK